MINDRIALHERSQRVDLFRARVAVVFERLPMLCGFHVTEDLSLTEVTVHGWLDSTALFGLKDEICTVTRGVGRGRCSRHCRTAAWTDVCPRTALGPNPWSFQMIRELMLAGVLAIALAAQPAVAADKNGRGVRNVVLVHGAFADGSNWARSSRCSKSPVLMQWPSRTR